MNRKISIYQKVIEFILTRNDEELGELTIERIISILKVSKSQMYEEFKDRHRFSPAVFLVLVKVFRSASLLEGKRILSVQKLSKKMGFSSSDYFIRKFKEYFGTTPGKYRNYIKKRTEK